jgi:hypothetical protein
MKPANNQTVPLTVDDRNFLLSVYDQRRRLIFVVYLILFAIALPISRRIDYRAKYSNTIVRWGDNDPDAKYVSRTGMKLINLGFLGTIILGSGAYFWFRRVAPLKKDANLGVKEAVPFLILRKEYYAVSDQYFFAVDDPVNLHYEVNENTYHRLSEGDTFYIYRGIHSRFVFEESGRYTIM